MRGGTGVILSAPAMGLLFVRFASGSPHLASAPHRMYGCGIVRRCGADATVLADDGRTAADVAREKGLHDLVALLEAHEEGRSPVEVRHPRGSARVWWADSVH